MRQKSTAVLAPRGVTAAAVAGWLKDGSRPASGRVVRRIAPGLDMVVPARGPASWQVRYQPRGLTPDGRRWPGRTLKIGTTQSHSLSEALDATVRLKARVLAGEDPAADRRAVAQRRREAALAAQARLTCLEALTLYRRLLETRGLSTKHVRDEVGHTRRALASVNLLDAPPISVTTTSLEAILARSPAGSRHAQIQRIASVHGVGVTQRGIGRGVANSPAEPPREAEGGSTARACPERRRAGGAMARRKCASGAGFRRCHAIPHRGAVPGGGSRQDALARCRYGCGRVGNANVEERCSAQVQPELARLGDHPASPMGSGRCDAP